MSTVPMAPGWAYVPDTGSSASASQPSARKRMRTLPNASQHETTAKQDAKIMRELAALDRENHRDVSIPVPVRHRDNAGRGMIFPSVAMVTVLTYAQQAMAKSLPQSARSSSLRRPSQTISQTTKHSQAQTPSNQPSPSLQLPHLQAAPPPRQRAPNPNHPRNAATRRENPQLRLPRP